MSENILVAGLPAQPVTSGAAVDLLSASTSGVPMANVDSWCLVVTTTQNITVSLYKRSGVNAGLALVTTYAVTSAAPLVLEFSDDCSLAMRVTAIAASTTASVACDFNGRA